MKNNFKHPLIPNPGKVPGKVSLHLVTNLLIAIVLTLLEKNEDEELKHILVSLNLKIQKKFRPSLQTNTQSFGYFSPHLAHITRALEYDKLQRCERRSNENICMLDN